MNGPVILVTLPSQSSRPSASMFSVSALLLRNTNVALRRAGFLPQ